MKPEPFSADEIETVRKSVRSFVDDFEVWSHDPDRVTVGAESAMVVLRLLATVDEAREKLKDMIGHLDDPETVEHWRTLVAIAPYIQVRSAAAIKLLDERERIGREAVSWHDAYVIAEGESAKNLQRALKAERALAALKGTL